MTFWLVRLRVLMPDRKVALLIVGNWFRGRPKLTIAHANDEYLR